MISRLDMTLHDGFSTITGETGAGKSIILGAIGLLRGQRADTRSIKSGEKRCVVEAVFDVEKMSVASFFEVNDLDFDDKECVIRREVSANGKSRSFINDTPVSVQLLKEIGEQLIDIHSQHQNLLIGHTDFQTDLLDIMSDEQETLSTYSSTYQRWKEEEKRLEDLRHESQVQLEAEEFLRFQAAQLSQAHLEEGELQRLEAEADVLSHAEEIKQQLYLSMSHLSSDTEQDTIQQVKSAAHTLEHLTDIYPQAEPLMQRLESCYIELKDIAEELESQAEQVEYDPSRLDWVNDRINTIHSLLKKHHVESEHSLLELQRQIEDKLLLIDNSENLIQEQEQKCLKIHDTLDKLASHIHAARLRSASCVEHRMTELLSPLGMPHVRFKIEIEELSLLGPKGRDNVSYLFSANKNSPMQPVSQVASGGEIARVMLALKSLLTDAMGMPTIIFDEIDTGVSGAIAEKMARMMQEMSERGLQVISITHLPQIAALGQHHYKVYKEDHSEFTTSHISELNQQERVEEIAHMLSGETLTQAAIDNARALLSPLS